MLRPIFIFFLNCCVLFLQAQVTSPFSFTHYSMKNGLGSNEITSVAQDRTGYLWITSNTGLQRFDGTRYKLFRKQQGNPHSLTSNILEQAYIDRDDNLWVLSGDGNVGIFDKNTFRYKGIPIKPRFPKELRHAQKRLLADEYGNLFLLMRGFEVIMYNKQKGEFTHEGSFIPYRPEWVGVISLAQEPGTQKYWIGLQAGGVAIYNNKTKNVSYRGHNVENEKAVDLFADSIGVTHSLIDRKGRLWFMDWGKRGGPFAMLYDPKDKQKPLRQYEFYSTLHMYHQVEGFMEQSNGRIWMRGLELLTYFNEEEKRFELIPNDYRNEQGIQYSDITYLLEDREKNIWVCTRHNGAFRFNPTLQYFFNITHPHPITGKQGEGGVLSFMELKNGDLITGVWGDGLYRYDRKMRSIPWGIRNLSPHTYPAVWDMCASADSNTIWMACQPGIFLLDQARNTMAYRNPPILNNRTTRQIVEDRKGNLWLGMHGYGLFRWINPKNEGRDSLVRVAESGTAMINKITKDHKGLIWVATGDKGLFLFNGDDGKFIRHWGSNEKGANTVFGDAISGVIEYNDSLMFVSTVSELFLFNRLRNVTTKIPLADELMGVIAVPQKDDAGYIWIGTTNALYRFHPFQRSLVMFNRFDGINNDRFVLSASYKRKDGTILMGNDNSFISFNPTAIKLADRHIPIVFTSLQIGKSELRIDSVLDLERLVIGPNDNSLTVEFSSLTFANEPIIQYKMDGIDEDWNTADRSHRAVFSFIPPGKHTLRLRSVNAEGIPSPNHTTLSILVKSPFWQTWWFYSMLAVTVAAVLFLLDRQRNKRKEALQRVRTDIAAGLHEEVNTALNNINILSEIARLKSDREPHRAKEYLEQIHTKSHNMIIALDDMLWSLDPENDAMDKTISRIKEYADALMQRHGVLIELLIDKKVERMQLNMKMRHEAFLLFKEGLRSLVSAGTKLCVVHLTAERGRLLFTIEFENDGCDMQKLNNLLHRRDMEARIHALKGKLNVQVHKSRSVFSLVLPLA